MSDFLDARKFGVLVARIHRELSDDEIARIAKTYYAWRGEEGAGKYADILGFCKSATTEGIASHSHVLTPGRYVGAEEQEDGGEPFDEKMKRLTGTLAEQFKERTSSKRPSSATYGGSGRLEVPSRRNVPMVSTSEVRSLALARASIL